MKLSEAVVYVTADNSQLKKGLNEAERDTRKSTRKMQSHFNNLKSSLNDIGSKLRNIGKTLTMGGGIGLAATAAGMGGLVKASADLQEELANVNTLFSDTKFQVDEYRQAIIELSREVPKSTSTLTDGLYQIKSAGIEAGNTLDFLKVSAIAATAGVTDVETTVNALTKTLAAYGKSGDDVLETSNKLFKAVEEGNITFEQLAEVIPEATAQAATAGMTMDELFGTIAAGVKTLKPSQVTTGISRMITGLQKASDEQQKLAEEAGFTFSIEAFREKGIVEFLRDMQEGLEDTNANYRDFFRRTQGARLANALLNESFEDLIENIDQVKDSQGAILVAFRKQMDTFNNQARLAWNNVTALAKAIGTELLPEYTDLAVQVRTVTSNLFEFVNANEDARERIANLINTTAKAIAGFFGLVTAAGLLSLGLGLIIKAVIVTAGVLSLLAMPITWLIVLVGLLYTAWEEDWGNIRSFTTEVASDVGNKIQSIISWVSDLYDNIAKGDWSSAWQQISSGLKDVWSDISDILFRTPEEAKMINSLSEMSGDPFPGGAEKGIIYKIQDAWNSLASWEGWSNMWTWIVDSVKPILTWEFLVNAWMDLKEMPLWGRLYNWIKDAFRDSLYFIQDTWDELRNWEGWANLYVWMKKYFNTSWQFVKDSWKDLKDWEGWKKLGDWIDKQTPEKLDIGLKKTGEITGMAINATANFTGKTYKAIKKGFETGDWSDAIGIGAEAWKTGINILVGLKLAQKAGAVLLSGIQSSIAWLGSAAGLATVIGIASIGIQLMEVSSGEKSFKDFGTNMIAAIAAGAGATLVGGPTAGVLAFTVMLNFEFGEWIREKLDKKLEPIRRMLGTEPNQEFIDIMLSDPTFTPDTALEQGPKEKGIWEKIKDVLGYAQGGITSGGTNQVAGVVHGGEWVMPNWMVEKYPQLASMLEGMRQKKGYKPGGLVGKAEQALNTARSGFSNTAGQALDTIMNLFNKFFDVIVEQLRKEFPKLAEQLEEAFDDAKQTINDLRGLTEGDGKDESEQAIPRIPTLPSKMDWDSWDELRYQIQVSWHKFIRNIINNYDSIKQITIDTVTNFYDDVSNWLQKPWSEQVDDMKNLFADMVFEVSDFFKNTTDIIKGVYQRLPGMLIQNLPIARDMLKGMALNAPEEERKGKGVIGGAIAGFQAGSIGALIGALVGLIKNSAIFGKIIKAINPVLKQLANVVGVILLPILKILTPILEVVGNALEWLAKIIVKMWNGLMEALDAVLGWAHDFDQYKTSMDELTDSTDKATQNIEETIPQVFKIALRRSQVATPGQFDPTQDEIGIASSAGTRRTNGGGDTYIIKGDIYGWNDFKEKVQQANGQIQRSQNMSELGVGTT